MLPRDPSVAGCRRTRNNAPSVCHRLAGMATIEHPLDRACSLLAGASQQLTTQGDYASTSAVLRCHEVIALLEECGAQGAQEPHQNHSAAATVDAVAQILDAIPADERPAKLGVARAELAGLALAINDSSASD